MKYFFKTIYIVLLFSTVINVSFIGLLQAGNNQILSIVTPFGAETTRTFKQAFENKYPNITVKIIKEKTNASVKFIEKTRNANTTDIFWASSPDAFKGLKDKGLLLAYTKKMVGIPNKIGQLTINDPTGFYKGFALSGYGIMENDYYTKTVGLPAAREWEDLKKNIYKDHIGMSSASRSGTTHIIVEILLQAKGWEEGWLLWKEIAANLKLVTARSADVPAGVNKGLFGLGLLIDYYALSYKALGFPISFTYPSFTALVPANIAIIADAPNIPAAKLFINFVLSNTGQKILLKEKISRLPVRPSAYVDTDRNFPNPFINKAMGRKVHLNIGLSENRYNVINSLFDVMITYNLDELKAAVRAIISA